MTERALIATAVVAAMTALVVGGWVFGDTLGYMRGHRDGVAQTRARMLGQEHRRHVIPVTDCPECGKATP